MGIYSWPFVAGATSYDIKVNNYSGSCTSNCFSVSDNGSRSVLVTFNQAGNYMVEVEARNNCGTTSSYQYVTVNSGGSGGGCQYNLELTSNNPASSVFQYRVMAPPAPCIVMEEEGTAQGPTSKNSLTILDQYGNTVINQNIDQDMFEIDLTHNETGVYFVRVNWKGQQLSDRIMKN